MTDIFIPDMYSQSIYRVNYEKLKESGIKLVIFDLDNTIVPVDEVEPRPETIELMFKIKELGIRPVLMSNSGKKRVEPFRNKLEIDSCASAKKPLKKNYEKIMSIFRVKKEEVACIGDQLLTDIFGANKMGMTSILINPISKKDRFTTKINRIFERFIMFILKKRDLFEKGKYYD